MPQPLDIDGASVVSSERSQYGCLAMSPRRRSRRDLLRDDAARKSFDTQQWEAEQQHWFKQQMRPEKVPFRKPAKKAANSNGLAVSADASSASRQPQPQPHAQHEPHQTPSPTADRSRRPSLRRTKAKYAIVPTLPRNARLNTGFGAQRAISSPIQTPARGESPVAAPHADDAAHPPVSTRNASEDSGLQQNKRAYVGMRSAPRTAGAPSDNSAVDEQKNAYVGMQPAPYSDRGQMTPVRRPPRALSPVRSPPTSPQMASSPIEHHKNPMRRQKQAPAQQQGFVPPHQAHNVQIQQQQEHLQQQQQQQQRSRAHTDAHHKLPFVPRVDTSNPMSKYRERAQTANQASLKPNTDDHSGKSRTTASRGVFS